MELCTIGVYLTFSPFFDLVFPNDDSLRIMILFLETLKCSQLLIECGIRLLKSLLELRFFWCFRATTEFSVAVSEATPRFLSRWTPNFSSTIILFFSPLVTAFFISFGLLRTLVFICSYIHEFAKFITFYDISFFPNEKLFLPGWLLN